MEEQVWDELTRTAKLVQASSDLSHITKKDRKKFYWLSLVVASLTMGSLVLTLPTRVTANGAADGTLFSLTNQDRASNGVGALQPQGTLSAIAENASYSGCGFTIRGRSTDMINRNYFAHPILNCGGKFVFAIMAAYGVSYLSAGENIGWVGGLTDPTAAANYINGQFMASPEHRSNILNSAYTNLGIGSAQASSWSGAGASQSNVYMFSEEFIQSRSSGAAAPPPKRQPAPAPPTSRVQPIATPIITAAATPPPVSSTPQPTPAPTSTPAPPPNPEKYLGFIAPPTNQNQGLLSNSVLEVLSAYLLN